MQRIHEVDALRGIALFGILLVNVFVFHAPYSYYGEFYGAFEGIELATVDAVVDFAGGKFLFIFAFLFGYGIVLQQASRGDSFRNYFVKRMLVLLLFGTLHILLFWFGDILASYAILGLCALPLLRLSNKGILIAGIFMMLFRPLYYLGVVLLDWPQVQMGKPAELDEFMSVFQQGSFVEIFQLRMKEFMAFMPENLVWYISKTMGLFLIGIYAARKKIFARISEQSTKYLIITLLLIVVSVVWILAKYTIFGMVDLKSTPIWRPILIGFNVLFESTLGFGYIIGFSLLFQNIKWLTEALSKTGRLALTNYITQSFICVLIFYSYGFGSYGKLLPTDLVAISIIIFGFNLSFSAYYLKRYQVGPLEYLWRRLIRNNNK